MRNDRIYQLINDCKEVISKEPACLYFEICEKKLVVVPDTHGDFRTTTLIVEKFLPDPNVIFIFLGDEVDKETSSLLPDQNILYLLSLKRKYFENERFYFILGNHSLNPYSKRFFPFQPCSFWDSLSVELRDLYESLFIQYPFMATTANGVIMCHSTLPLFNEMEAYDINNPEYQECLWADYKEDQPEYYNPFSIRPAKYKEEFQHSLQEFGGASSILLRGHDPSANLLMYDGKCITMQSSRAFSRAGLCDRRIAIVDLSKEKISSAADIDILNIDKNFEPEDVCEGTCI